MKRVIPLRWHAVIVVAVLAIAGLYLHGTFDRPLYSIGLNFHECARNGFGAAFCGQELDEYRERVQHAQEKLQQAKEQITHIGQETQAKTEEAAQLQQAEEASRKNHELRVLIVKMDREKRLMESEPEGSYGWDLAHSEYEYARAQARQIEANYPRGP